MNEDRTPAVLADVDAFCRELRPSEELCYVEHRPNDQIVTLAKRHGVLGIPVPEEYGGRGAGALPYARCLARLGREGTGVRTFFSGHTSIGQYPIFRYGSAEQSGSEGAIHKACIAPLQALQVLLAIQLVDKADGGHIEFAAFAVGQFP